MSSGTQRQVTTTKGWEVNLKRKDGRTTWEKLKDIKDSYPVQLAEYTAEKKISEESAFEWWFKFILRKRDCIISKTQRCWLKTHTYGICVLNTFEEANLIDKVNAEIFWWDAIMKYMKNVRPAFEVFEKHKEEIPIEYQQIKCQMIFDFKLGANFRRKEILVGGGHMTTAPASIAYS